MSITVHHGDMLQVLPTLEADSFHACVTDPPYHLTSIVKRFGSSSAAPVKAGATGAFVRASKGFMGKTWDGGDVAFQPETWAEVLRVMKPGAHLVAFGGTRTFHRMAVAIEDAGFELRDTLMYLYGSGFPKSHNAGNGWGTALKPAWEPIILARKPLSGTVAANVLAHGTGALNIDGCRIGTDGGTAKGSKPTGAGNGIYGAGLHGACEIVALDKGRWPANVIHDGSDEVLAAFPDTGAGSFPGTRGCGDLSTTGHRGQSGLDERKTDAGSVARFFYTAKADATDRAGSKHPTVKPVSLMRYLVRLITPPNGLVLDCFAGSGHHWHGVLGGRLQRHAG